MASTRRNTTPRRQKVWARSAIGKTWTNLTSGNTLSVDVLGPYQADMGVAKTASVTIMRQVMRFWWTIGDNHDAALTRWDFTGAFAWLSRGETSSEPAIPVPSAQGLRETPWTHRWDQLFHASNEAGELANKTRGNPNYFADVSQMRKQPTPDHEFHFVGIAFSANPSLTGQEVTLRGVVDTLLALP